MSNTFYVIPKNSDLQHYGVLGMKWGVRRYQNVDGSLTPAGQKRYKSEETKTKRALRVLKSGAIVNLMPGVKEVNGVEYINQQASNSFKNIKNVLDSKINEAKQKTGEDVYKSVEENIKNMSEIDMEIELRNWKKVDEDN